MRRLASLVAILLLFAGAAPLLACMTGTPMSQEESACCRAMHDRCGGMAKMGCCRSEVRTDAQPQLLSSAPTLHLAMVPVAPFAMFVAPAQSISQTWFQTPATHSPPGLLIADTAVLRI